jgi:hypothetical protein
MAAVPAALIDDIALIGLKARIAERLALWRQSPVTTLIISTVDLETVRLMAELVL